MFVKLCYHFNIMHSTSWKDSCILCISLETVWNILIKFWNRFSRNILTFLRLKFETSTQSWLLTTTCYLQISKSLFYLIFLNKQTIFHYNKLIQQQNGINRKRHTILKFKLRLQSMKNSEKQTKNAKKTNNKRQKAKQKKSNLKKHTRNKTKQKKKGRKKRESVVYLFLHQNLFSTIHLRYWNYVIC